MSYLTFHVLFLLPPLLVLGFTLQRPPQFEEDLRATIALPLICLIAVSYTTPWDNYLVAQEIWWYGPDRVLGTIGHVPIEEYLFFVLQPLLTGFVLYHFLARYGGSLKTSSSLAPWLGAAVFLGLTALGGVFLFDGQNRTLYLSLILIWAPPLLAGMWLYDGETLWALRTPISVSTAIPTLYLWIADAVAIHTGIWTISPEYTTGLSAFGLPLEEASFFLFTNLLVVQGILLLLYGSHEALSRQSARL